jgi:aspartyl aminopeptidase
MRSTKPLALAALLSLCMSATMAQDNPGGSVWATKKASWLALKEGQRDEVFKFTDKYKQYLTVAKTAMTSTTEAIRMAKAAGFVEFTDPSQVKPGARLILPARERALVLAVIGQQDIVKGSNLIGTHHDSPHIDLKPRPVIGAVQNSLALFKTMYYGGLKKYHWANLPLALVGRIVTPDGRKIDVSVGFEPNDPVFVIGDSAPHSDKDLRARTYVDVLKGEEMMPVIASIPGEKTSVVAEVLRSLKDKYKIQEEDLVSADLQLIPAHQPRDVGFDRGLIGAYGQDDRLSTYCALQALFEISGTPAVTALAYVSNFEEAGSVNNTGAQSELLSTAYARLVAGQKGNAYNDLHLRIALRNAQVISADTNDGMSPLFNETSEATNAAKVGFGVTIKRYGKGFDANSEYTAYIRNILDKAGIPWQTQTPKVDVGGGGTIGGFMSQQDMEVIDMGVPLISMHSPFEMSSKVDVWHFYRFMKAFYAAPAK